MNIDEMKDRINRAEEIQRYTENRCEALEKENAELKLELTKKADINHSLVEQMAEQNDQLIKAKEILKKFKPCIMEMYLKQDISNIKLSLDEIEEIEQFLSEVEK